MDSMMVNRLASYGIDYNVGIERFGGNEEMLKKFIRRYSEDTHFCELQKALEAQDIEQAYRIAHTLKGVVGNLSFTQYFQVVGPLADHLKEGQLEEALQLMPALQEAHDKALLACKEL